MGHLTRITTDKGQYTFTYFSGNVVAALAPEGVNLSYQYNGPFITNNIWSGIITGHVGWVHDGNLRIKSITVNNTDEFSLSYDRDGLLTNAGLESIVRDMGNGRIISTVLGAFVDEVMYNEYGEVTNYLAMHGGTNIFQEKIWYDDVGRITNREEYVSGKGCKYAYHYNLRGNLSLVFTNGILRSTYRYDGNDNCTTVMIDGVAMNFVVDDCDHVNRVIINFGEKTNYTGGIGVVV